MKQRPRRRGMEGFWPKIVLRKWLNISTNDSDFSADEEADTESEFDSEDGYECGEESHHGGRRMNRLISDVSTSGNSSFNRHWRRKSEMVRAQYINTKELRMCVGTWNVGGKLPTDGSDIEEWLDVEDPADIYVLGLQEIVPLNAGNVLGAEDNRPITRWESLIRERLNRIRSAKPNVKCHSDPPSPSRFKPSDDALPIEDELLSETDSGSEEEIHPLVDQIGYELNDESFFVSKDDSESLQASKADKLVEFDIERNRQPTPRKLSRFNQSNIADNDLNTEAFDTLQRPSLARLLSNSEKIGLSWPEKPLDLENQISLLHSKSLKSMESFKRCSFKPGTGDNINSLPVLFPGLEKLNSITRRKSPAYVRIISKQMVGIFLSVWVRRGLRKHIQNVKVSTVGVGVMGYMGNKGSVAVSMSIYQTLFCFICCHLSSGEKEGDELRRNSDVREIHRRTLFNSVTNGSFPKTIYDHERIIWLGDLNYRINLSHERTWDLVSEEDWSKLREMDQLKHKLEKGHIFDGWLEGDLDFPPTYKYEINSTNFGDKRRPAWCDRILSFGKGMRLLSYKRSELKLSDHRPVTATFMSEVEVFCHRKLQKALTLTDAEIENIDKMSDLDGGLDRHHP